MSEQRPEASVLMLSERPSQQTLSQGVDAVTFLKLGQGKGGSWMGIKLEKDRAS